MTDLPIAAPDGGQFTTYVACPVRLPAPGLVLVQYICGVNPVMRRLADQFATLGYLVMLGVANLLYTYYPGTSPHPKSHILNQRSMEIFHELGLADKIYALSTPADRMRAAGWYAGLRVSHPCAGREIGRVKARGAGCEDPDYVAASPRRPAPCSGSARATRLRRMVARRSARTWGSNGAAPGRCLT